MANPDPRVRARALLRGAIVCAFAGDTAGAQELVRELEALRAEAREALDCESMRMVHLLADCDADGTLYGHGFAQEAALGAMERAVGAIRRGCLRKNSNHAGESGQEIE
jgi:hypothetical protein